jgi:hypothetical protein
VLICRSGPAETAYELPVLNASETTGTACTSPLLNITMIRCCGCEIIGLCGAHDNEPIPDCSPIRAIRQSHDQCFDRVQKYSRFSVICRFASCMRRVRT